ncbi:10526_t:CDS:2, partial [Racocetra fulgida]
FDNWDLAIKHVENYIMENGFKVVKCQTQKNKGGEIVCRTLECKHSGEYKAKIKADTEENREHESIKIGCSWKVNFYLSNGIIRVTSMSPKHNHPLLEVVQDIEIKFCHLTPEMLEEIEFLVKIGCDAGPIICGLQKRFPNATIKYEFKKQWSDLLNKYPKARKYLERALGVDVT